jgi:hypothetical protein
MPELLERQSTKEAVHYLWKTKGGFMVETSGNVLGVKPEQKYKNFLTGQDKEAKVEFLRRVNCW